MMKKRPHNAKKGIGTKRFEKLQSQVINRNQDGMLKIPATYCFAL